METDTLTNAMGVRVLNATAYWRTDAGVLLLRQYGSQIDQGIGMISAAWASALDEQRKAEARKRNPL